MKNNKKWWDSLTDEQKWQNYELLQQIQEHQLNVLNKIGDHLLGDDWYVVCGDWESVPNEMLEDIKYRYPNVNYSWSRQWKKIKTAIKEYFNNRKG